MLMSESKEKDREMLCGIPIVMVIVGYDCELTLLPFSPPADPYVAAEDFLSTNHLPSYYLDQVAEFITTNAGEYHGAMETSHGDPFTGKGVAAASLCVCMCVWVGSCVCVWWV